VAHEIAHKILGHNTKDHMKEKEKEADE